MWEEHWPALELFLAMRTQWRTAIGMSGGQRLGIDYTSLYGHPKYARLDADAQEELLGRVQHIESGALAAMSETPVSDEDDRRQIADAIAERVALVVDHEISRNLVIFDQVR